MGHCSGEGREGGGCCVWAMCALLCLKLCYLRSEGGLRGGVLGYFVEYSLYLGIRI